MAPVGRQGVQIIGLKDKESLAAVLLAQGALETIKACTATRSDACFEERHLAQRARAARLLVRSATYAAPIRRTEMPHKLPTTSVWLIADLARHRHRIAGCG
jgi:hypothetical protein